jgi:hypothetical protein
LLPLRLPLDGEAPRDLVPVDWVAEAIVGIVGRPECHGATYHLTAARPTPTAWIRDAAEEALGIEGLSFSGPSGPPDPTPIEALFLDRVRSYWPYLGGDPSFDRSQVQAALPGLPPPEVDRACLARLIRFAVADGWGRSRRKSTSAPAIDCRRYVEDFFPDALRNSTLAGVPLDVAAAFDVEGDGGGAWTLRWAGGELLAVERGRSAAAEVVYRLDSVAFAAVVSGRLPIHEAHESRQVEIEGDVEKGLKLAALFARFVQERPYHPAGREGDDVRTLQAR